MYTHVYDNNIFGVYQGAIHVVQIICIVSGVCFSIWRVLFRDKPGQTSRIETHLWHQEEQSEVWRACCLHGGSKLIFLLSRCFVV